MRGLWVLVAAFLLLGGCTYFAAPGFQFGREPALHYLERVSSLTEIERQTELEEMESLSATENTVTTTTKIALLRGLQEGASAADEAYALSRLETLNEAVPGFVERDYYQLGLLVRELLLQRRASREAQQIHTDFQQQLEAMRKEKLLLQSQIEALKNIETQINQRQQQENVNGANNN